MTSFWDQPFLNNSIRNWGLVLAIILGGLVLLRILRYIFLKKIRIWAEKTSTNFDDFILLLIEKMVLPFLSILCFYIGLHWLENIPNPPVIRVAIIVVATFFLLRIISASLQYGIISYLKLQEDAETKQKQASGLLIIMKFIVWSLGVLFLLDNFGYNITTIVAGLGIGGIAIALAAQTILADLFSYFVILFDRPFEIDDFIVVDDKVGVVEYIGIKTTRLKALSGEQLIFSNKNLTDSIIHNYKRMEKRRSLFSLGVTYQTPSRQLERIPEMVKSIIDLQEGVIFDRGHFSGFGDFSLNFEFVYYIENADFQTYMDMQQSIYLKIHLAFEKEGIEFAFPTQTLYVARDK